jgi:hypothetical protein
MFLIHIMITSPKNCALLIPSCDLYSDLWKPFFAVFFRNWPDCPYEIYLGSNTFDFSDSRVKVLKSGHGANWADRTLDHLGQIKEPIILLWLEDFFLRSRVDSGAVSDVFREFCVRDAHMLRLVRRPGPTFLLSGLPFGPISPNAAYRVSTQVAFWRKETLMNLIAPGESIWQFEHAGSVRSNSYSSGFYAVGRDVVPYKHHVVERGQWFPWEAWHFGRMDIGCDFNRRRIMPSGTAAKWMLRKAVGISGAGRIWKILRRVLAQKST